MSIPKLCDKFICKPFNIIFKCGLMRGIFQSEWKKVNASICSDINTNARIQTHKKKKTKNVFKATGLFLFHQFMAKLLNVLLIYRILIRFRKQPHIRKVRIQSLGIPVSRKYQVLLIKYLPALMRITKLEGCSSTYLKLSINQL